MDAPGSLRFVRAGAALFALGLASAFSACTRAEPAEETRIRSRGEAVLWTNAGTLAENRCQHAAVELGDGRILLCGGRVTASTASGTCDIYRLGQGFASAGAGSLDPPRHSFTLTSTEPGQAVAIGGVGAALLGIVDNYTVTPTGGEFTRDPSIFVLPRFLHATVAFSSGHLLVTGGVGPGSITLTTDERFIDGDWAAAGSSRRHEHTATVLQDGNRALLFGGVRTVSGAPGQPPVTTVLSTHQLYTDSSNSLSPEASEGEPRRGHTATLLENGDVLIAGGASDLNTAQPLRTALRFRPGANPAWIPTASMNTARASHAAALIDGRVVVTGGRTATATVNSVEVYDPATNRWSTLAPMPGVRQLHTLTRVDERRLLVAGGCNAASTPVNTAQLFAPALDGEACVPAANECLSGVCIGVTCCEEPCAEGYACPGDGVCRTTCAGASDCASTHFCDDGQCVPKLDQGGVCADDGECDGLPCVDGRCCAQQCGQCEACDVDGLEGTCQLINGPPREGREPCGGVGAGTECASVCNANSGACEYPGGDCGEPTCVGGLETPVGACDNGSCVGDEPRECNEYACDPGTEACRADCETNEHCGVGFVCKDRVCEEIAGRGDACTATSECTAGLLCVDDVCCVEECAEGFSCALLGPRGLGVCTQPNGAACERPNDCASQNCVDGYCCSAPCQGQCEACNLPNNEGTCTAYSGSPPADGSRPDCDDSPDNVCADAACDGRTRTSCAGFEHGLETSCTVARCDGEGFVPAAACDGSGACQTPTPIPCGGYRCVDDQPCPTSCDEDADCVEDHTCRDGECLPGGFCADDGVTFQAENGEPKDCTPFACRGDGCLEACDSIDDCHPDYNCDPVTGNCVAATEPGSNDDDAGCGCKLPGRPSAAGDGWAAVLALALLGARRRRRPPAASATT